MNQKTVFTIFACIALFLSGVFVEEFLLDGPQHPSRFSEKRLSGGYAYINPLLECNQDLVSNPLRVSKVSEDVATYIDAQKQSKTLTQAGVYFRDLNNGPWFGVNQDVRFSPASLIKVPMMMAIFKMAEDTPALFDKKVPIQNIDAYADQDYVPLRKLEVGKVYSVHDLVVQMVTDSDNVAYNALLDIVTPGVLDGVYRDLDVDISDAAKDPAGNILSIKDYASFFRILYNSSYLSKKSSEEALKILSQSTFQNGLVVGVPPGVSVSHKFGERDFALTGEKQLHDCGIVYKKQHPYLLCVMTRGTDFTALSGVIKTLSSIVYNGAQFDAGDNQSNP